MHQNPYKRIWDISNVRHAYQGKRVKIPYKNIGFGIFIRGKKTLISIFQRFRSFASSSLRVSKIGVENIAIARDQIRSRHRRRRSESSRLFRRSRGGKRSCSTVGKVASTAALIARPPPSCPRLGTTRSTSRAARAARAARTALPGRPRALAHAQPQLSVAPRF